MIDFDNAEVIPEYDENDFTCPEESYGYYLNGGGSYSPSIAPGGKFYTLQDAVNEWLYFRDDQIGTPCWGDAMDDSDDAVVLCSETDMFKSWTRAEVMNAYGEDE